MIDGMTWWMQAIIGMIALLGIFWVYTRWIGRKLQTIRPPADVAAPPADALAHDGIHSRVLQAGEGDVHPGPDEVVAVHYTGWMTDGEMFDSSVLREEASTFPLSDVIPGWHAGLCAMVVGEKRRMWIPVDLAYGEDAASKGMPPGMLVFDVELLAIGQDAIEARWRH